MEADDRGDAAGLQAVGEDRQQAVEVGQLAVDEDPQRLEGAGGGVELAPAARLSVKSRAAQTIAVRSSVVSIGRAAAALDDQRGDRVGVVLVAQLAQGGGQFPLAASC